MVIWKERVVVRERGDVGVEGFLLLWHCEFLVAISSHDVLDFLLE